MIFHLYYSFYLFDLFSGDCFLISEPQAARLGSVSRLRMDGSVAPTRLSLLPCALGRTRSSLIQQTQDSSFPCLCPFGLRTGLERVRRGCVAVADFVRTSWEGQRQGL